MTLKRKADAVANAGPGHQRRAPPPPAATLNPFAALSTPLRGHSTDATRELSKRWSLPLPEDYSPSKFGGYSSRHVDTKHNSWSQVRFHERDPLLRHLFGWSSDDCEFPTAEQKSADGEIVVRHVQLRLRPRQPLTQKQLRDQKKGLRRAKFAHLSQRQKLDLAFRANRFTYNQVVEAWRDKRVGHNQTEMRNICTTQLAIDSNPKKYKWLEDVPYDIRDSAVIDVYNAIKSSKALHRDTVKPFELKFRSARRDKSESFIIGKRYWKDGVIFKMIWGDAQPLRGHEALPSELTHDCRLQRTWLNKFYLCMPERRPPENENILAADVIALDPGVRTFMTGYDPDGCILEWGVGDMTRIGRLQHAYSKLQSRVADKSTKRRKRTRLKRAMRRIDCKVRDLTDDTHKKLASALCQQYHTILIPKFESKRMSSTVDRKIGKRTVRDMQNWRHYSFRQRLITKAKNIQGCTVIECDESYTTKTCGQCGEINDVGRNKTFHCRFCALTCDRDWNAARNICIRTVCERGFFRESTRCGQAPSLLSRSECMTAD